VKELTKKPILYVDATPNEGYPLRILQAYRDDCDCNWATDTAGNCDNPLLELMNEHNQQRAEILDKAITILRKAQNE
jgi:hypothetical protein